MFNRLYSVILLYIFLIMIIMFIKPAMLFDASGSIKEFDYDNNNLSSSLLNMEVVLSILAIFCYFIVISLELALY